MFYRSSWVPKEMNGNTHGYTKQEYVGSLAMSSEVLPDALRCKLSVDEVEFVLAKVVDPARKAALMQGQLQASKQRDPVWRLDDALRLVKEASALSVCALVPDGRVDALRGELQKVKTVQGASARPVLPSDPLTDALLALRRAASAVRDGRYGDAQRDGVRGSSTYQKWVQIYREIEGSAGPDSLLRALQARGFAKTKAR